MTTTFSNCYLYTDHYLPSGGGDALLSRLDSISVVIVRLPTRPAFCPISRSAIATSVRRDRASRNTASSTSEALARDLRLARSRATPPVFRFLAALPVVPL